MGGGVGRRGLLCSLPRSPAVHGHTLHVQRPRRLSTRRSGPPLCARRHAGWNPHFILVTRPRDGACHHRVSDKAERKPREGA